MIKNSRTDEILSIVNASGRISVAELAKKTYSSASTIRRDLEKLEQMGLLRRHHGGAESVLFLRPPQIIRQQYNQAEKRILAERAALLVAPNSTIFIDASTTAQYMIPHLASVKNLKVYTNGIDTAIRLAEAGICTICTGGELFSESMAYVGSVASDTVRRVYFDAMFFSSAGFDDSVISDWSEAETEIRRIVIEQSAKRFFLADHTKRGKRYTHIVCRVNEIDEIISE
jgi:DeoR family fructose operon transcriptional repressor